MDFWQWVRNEWDRALAIAAAVAGAVALVLGWLGVSRSVLPTQQIPYLASGAVGGILLLGISATLWLSSDLRDEWRKLDDIQTDIRRAIDALGTSEASGVNGHQTPTKTSESRTPA